MQCEYNRLVVDKISCAKYDGGIYIKKASFSYNGEPCCTYSEPKQMSGYPYVTPECEVIFTKSDTEYILRKLAAEYGEDDPAGIKGRFDKQYSVRSMLSDMAWTARSIKEANTQGIYAAVFLDTKHMQTNIKPACIYAVSDYDLKRILESKAYRDLCIAVYYHKTKSHIILKPNSVIS